MLIIESGQVFTPVMWSFHREQKQYIVGHWNELNNVFEPCLNFIKLIQVFEFTTNTLCVSLKKHNGSYQVIFPSVYDSLNIPPNRDLILGGKVPDTLRRYHEFYKNKVLDLYLKLI